MSSKHKKEELIKILNEMITTYENLPQNAMITPITHYDYISLLLLVRELFRFSFIDDNCSKTESSLESSSSV